MFLFLTSEDINQLAVVGILAALKQRDYVFEYVREVMEPWWNGSVAGDGPFRHPTQGKALHSGKPLNRAFELEAKL